MTIVFALIVAPLLALADQATAFAMVSWSCTHTGTLAIHGVHLVFLAATVAAAAIAFARWRSATEHRFLCGVATASATLSALAIVAMWIPVWMISPCIA
jgi:hypothetical protein